MLKLHPACLTQEQQRELRNFDVAASVFYTALHDNLLRLCPPVQKSDCSRFLQTFLSSLLKRKMVVLKIIPEWVFCRKNSLIHSAALQYYGLQGGTKYCLEKNRVRPNFTHSVGLRQTKIILRMAKRNVKEILK